MGTKRQAIELWQKQQVVEWIKNEGNGIPNRAIKHFNTLGWKLDGGVVSRWWRQREEILSAAPTQKRLKGGGRKPSIDGLEDVLLDAIIAKRSSKENVTRTWIAEMALSLNAAQEEDERVENFCAYPHWIDNFMKRYGLSLRRRTNLTVLTDEAFVVRAVSYMQFLQNERDKMDLNMTILMDETAIYFEDPRTTTIDHTGARHVVIHSTGFASMRITVVLAVTALGKKLSPLLIYKGGNSTTFEKVGSCYVVYQKKRHGSILIC